MKIAINSGRGGTLQVWWNIKIWNNSQAFLSKKGYKLCAQNIFWVNTAAVWVPAVSSIRTRSRCSGCLMPAQVVPSRTPGTGKNSGLFSVIAVTFRRYARGTVYTFCQNHRDRVYFYQCSLNALKSLIPL